MQVSMAPERARVPLIKLTHTEERPFRDGLSFLAMTASLWSNILYSELQLVFTNHPAIPIAATDAHRVYFNPAGVAKAKFTIENLCFVYAHEVMHYIRGDLIMAAYWNDVGVVTLADGKTIPYHHDLMNCAMDFVINGGLKSAMIGDMPACALYDETLSAKGMESSIDVYVILYNRAKQQQKQDPGMGMSLPGGGKPGQTGFDIHLRPEDEVLHDEKYGNGKEKRELAIAAAVEAAQQQGTLPGFMQRIIGEIMQPKVRWEDQLSTAMSRSAGEPGLDWGKFNKRLISRPGQPIAFARRVAKGCGTVVVGVDTSGSINEKILDRFFSEMTGIVTSLQPRELHVVWCDAAVRRVDRIEDPTDLKDLHQRIEVEGIPGGGGSDMRPIFAKIKELGIQPDMAVILTDMFVEFPKSKPMYDTIWCSVSKGRPAPFGKLIEVEV